MPTEQPTNESNCAVDNPCHPDRAAHDAAAYLADTGRLAPGITVREVAEIIAQFAKEKAAD